MQKQLEQLNSKLLDLNLEHEHTIAQLKNRHEEEIQKILKVNNIELFLSLQKVTIFEDNFFYIFSLSNMNWRKKAEKGNFLKLHLTTIRFNPRSSWRLVKLFEEL